MTKKHVYQSKPLDQYGHAHYTDIENATWAFLFHRQKEIIKNRASQEFIKGVELLEFGNKIPQHMDVTSILNARTGWGVEPVPALIQPETFFSLLARKRFPAANLIRIPEELDYIMEPDVFHEFFGHCPLLLNEAYAQFMYEYGKLALKAEPKLQRRLFRLFWFTIEFGLIKEGDEFKVYGGGILSSKSEAIYAVESDVPIRSPLNALEALRTPFRIDILQPVYFYIEKYEGLFNLLDQKPFELAQLSLTLEDFPARFERKKKSVKNHE